MAIEKYDVGDVEFINNPNDPNAIYYRKKKLMLDPEYVDKTYKMAKEFKNDRIHNKGFSKDKTMKWHGSVPSKVWFDKISEAKDPDYWRRDKYRNYKRWINANPIFRAKDSIA